MKAKLALLALALPVLFLSACSTPTVSRNGASAAPGLSMGCLHDALIMQNALKSENINSKVVTLRWSEAGRQIAHAVVVFRYGEKLAAWDKTHGSITIGNATDYSADPSTLGALYLNKKAGFRQPYLLYAAAD